MKFTSPRRTERRISGLSSAPSYIPRQRAAKIRKLRAVSQKKRQSGVAYTEYEKTGRLAVRRADTKDTILDWISTLARSQTNRTVSPVKMPFMAVCQTVGSLKAKPGAIR
nr:hypothetical protein [Succinivibrionaceae bacterium]